jgi:hypothetical protein
MLLRVVGRKRPDRRCLEVGTSKGTVAGRVGGKDHRRNVDLASKKPDLRTSTKTATKAGKSTKNMVEGDTDTVELG